MSRGVFIVSRDPSNQRDILFQQSPNHSGEIPEEQLALKDQIEQTLAILRMLFPNDDARFREYFDPLVSLAQTGLVGESAQTNLARRTLISLKTEITDRESGRIKNRYMKKLGLTAVFLGVPPLICAVFILTRRPDLLWLSNFMLLWVGCMVGVWLSFGARKTVLRFEELHIVEKDRLEPVVRLILATVHDKIILGIADRHGISVL